MNWHLFAQIWQNVGEPLNALINGVYTAVFAWIRPGYKGGAILFMAFTSGLLLTGRLGEVGRDWLPILVRVVLVACVLNVTFYNTVIRDTFLHTIPEGLVQAISSATSGQMGNGTIPQTFDKTFIDAMAAGIKVTQVSAGGFAIAIARAIFIYAVYMPLAALAIFVAFGIWFASQFLLAMLIAVGPIFLAFLAFPATRRYFELWISAMAGIGLMQGLVILALSIILTVETTLVRGVLTMDAAADDAGTAQIVMLVSAVAVYLLFAFVLKEIPGLSASVIGGTHSQISGISRAMFSQPLANAGHTLQRLENRAASSVASGLSSKISPPGRPIGRS